MAPAVAGHPSVKKLPSHGVADEMKFLETAVVQNGFHCGWEVVFGDIVEIEPFPGPVWGRGFRVPSVAEQIHGKACVPERPGQGVVSFVVKALMVEAEPMGQENGLSR